MTVLNDLFHPGLEEAYGLVGLASPDQFGEDSVAVREALALLVALQFEAFRVLRNDDEYEAAIVVSELEEGWVSFTEDLGKIRKRHPAAVLN